MAERSGNGTVYELSGPEEAPVVVLIHGLGVNRQLWQWHEPALSARYRVLRYDLFSPTARPRRDRGILAGRNDQPPFRFGSSRPRLRAGDPQFTA